MLFYAKHFKTKRPSNSTSSKLAVINVSTFRDKTKRLETLFVNLGCTYTHVVMCSIRRLSGRVSLFQKGNKGQLAQCSKIIVVR